jgi:hypothetical protein
VLAILKQDIDMVFVVEVGEELTDVLVLEPRLNFDLSFELVIEVRAFDFVLGDYLDGDLCEGRFIDSPAHLSELSVTDDFVDIEEVKSQRRVYFRWSGTHGKWIQFELL